MVTTQFDRNAMACWYATQHLDTDPGIVAVHHLPRNADEREIRLVEVNNLIADQNDGALEPIDFGVDIGTESAHRLFVLDVTPDQWDRIVAGKLALPAGWSIDGSKSFERNQ
jgi:hypothetical protein